MEVDQWWPFPKVFFPELGNTESQCCQEYVSEMIKTLALNKKHIRSKKGGYCKRSTARQTPPNDLVDAHLNPSFNYRRPDIVMYKANQRGACSITLLGDVKGRSSDGEFPNAEVGHVLDMVMELFPILQMLSDC